MLPDIPKLSAILQRELDTIEPSVFEPGLLLYPCSAKLRDGTEVAHMYFVEVSIFRKMFRGESPLKVPGLRWVSPDAIESIAPDPTRLPVRFANELYRMTDVGWGTRIFTLVFSWWCRRYYSVGSLVDFLEYPARRGPEDIKRVILYGKRKRLRTPTPEPSWCVFST
jgi:hypothetical protein